MFREMGVSRAERAGQAAPGWLMEAGTLVKEAFLRGFLLADGARNLNMRVHTPNQDLLLDPGAQQRRSTWTP